MPFKFEQLDVWKMSLDYSDDFYELAEKLPKSERFNLKSQITRAVTFISLNIAEGSTGQSDSEQSSFLGMAIRSLIETVACQRLITRRNYINDKACLEELDFKAQELAKRLHALHRSLATSSRHVGEEQALYDSDEI